MYITETQPESLFGIEEAKLHMRLDPAETIEDGYIAGLIAAATSNAEKVMGCSLLTREITATFYGGELLSLPRGPVVSITSVSLNDIPQPSGAYSIERYGHTELLRYQNGNLNPHPAPAEIKVVYVAGYGDSTENVPADIVQVIKCHVGLMYEQREVATDRTVTPVPFIENFYKLHSREPGVG